MEFLKLDEFRSQRLDDESPTGVVVRVPSISFTLLRNWYDELKPLIEIGRFYALPTHRSCKYPRSIHVLLSLFWSRHDPTSLNRQVRLSFHFLNFLYILPKSPFTLFGLFIIHYIVDSGF